MYAFINILIASYSTIPILIEILNLAKSWIPGIYASYTHNEVMPSPKYLAQMILVFIYVLLDIFINALLLYLHVKALHIYSKVFATGNASGKRRFLDDREHELMLEAARYTVLFGTLLVFNVCGIVIGIIVYMEVQWIKRYNTDYVDAAVLIIQSISICVWVLKDVLGNVQKLRR